MSKSKKLRAALTAVIYYLQKERDEKNIVQNLWARSGREMIMKNQEMVQRKHTFR